MLNWSSSASSAAPITYDQRPIPGGVDPTIKQPTEEVLQFTWIVSRTKGNNEFQCKICDHRFIGQPVKVNLDHIARTGTADEFWVRAPLADKTGTELFRKLVNGYCGQGESERMNKQVKEHRTTVRNRQIFSFFPVHTLT